MINWNESLLWILGLSSLMFGASIVVAGVLIIKLPTDYLTREENSPSGFLRSRPLLRGIVWFLKNVAGLLFLVAGVVMLLTPGQGLLFIFLGLTLVDFPGKRELLHKFVRRPGVMHTINKVRKIAGRPPLEEHSEIHCPAASNRQNLRQNR